MNAAFIAGKESWQVEHTWEHWEKENEIQSSGRDFHLNRPTISHTLPGGCFCWREKGGWPFAPTGYTADFRPGTTNPNGNVKHLVQKCL